MPSPMKVALSSISPGSLRSRSSIGHRLADRQPQTAALQDREDVVDEEFQFRLVVVEADLDTADARPMQTFELVGHLLGASDDLHMPPEHTVGRDVVGPAVRVAALVPIVVVDDRTSVRS